jgi:hypothetical protein
VYSQIDRSAHLPGMTSYEVGAAAWRRPAAPLPPLGRSTTLRALRQAAPATPGRGIRKKPFHALRSVIAVDDKNNVPFGRAKVWWATATCHVSWTGVTVTVVLSPTTGAMPSTSYRSSTSTWWTPAVGERAVDPAQQRDGLVHRGSSSAVALPTQSARVERSRSMPSRSKIWLCR